MLGHQGRVVRFDPARVGPLRARTRRRHGRLRVRAGARPDTTRCSAPSFRTREARATARPAPRRTTCRCTARCWTAATCCSSTSAEPAARSRSTARTCRTSRAAYAPAAGRCGRSLGDPRRQLHLRGVRGRPRGRHPGAAPRPGRPVRRLVRHVLRPGVRRPAPRPAAQRRARQRVPDVRRERLVSDPDAGDAARPSRWPAPRSTALRDGRPDADAAAPSRPGSRAHPSLHAASATTPTGAR